MQNSALGKGWKRALSVFRGRAPDFLAEELALMHAPEATGHLAFVAAGRHGLPSSYQDPVRRRMGSERGLACLKPDGEIGASRWLGSQHPTIQARLRLERHESMAP